MFKNTADHAMAPPDRSANLLVRHPSLSHIKNLLPFLIPNQPMSAGWHEQCILGGPSKPYSLLKSLSAQADSFDPFGHCTGFTTKRYASVVFGVSRLLFLGSPSTIVFAISRIVINAIQAVLRSWPIPQIAQKVMERVLPVAGNCNATATIPSIRFIPLIQAATFHLRPSLVFGSEF